MASDLTLSYYYLRYGTLAPGLIKVRPDTTVDKCKELILQRAKSESPTELALLYSTPESHPVSLNDVYSTLGALSVSDLGLPLPIHLSMRDIFGLEPEKDRLHLVLVDRGIPLSVEFWISNIQATLVVDVKEKQEVASFLSMIKERDPTLEGDFTFYKTPYTKGSKQLETMRKDQPLPNFSELFSAFDDISFSMLPCVTVRAVRPEQKHEPSWKNAERALKRRKILSVAPSSLDYHLYLTVQASGTERLIDFRTPVNYTTKIKDRFIPPIEVLFHGFGEFLDIWRAASMPNFKLDSAELDIHVDGFVSSMSRIYPDKATRREAGLDMLNLIFPPTNRRNRIAPEEIPRIDGVCSLLRTDGHSVFGRLGIPCIIVEFKNESGCSNTIPIAELVSYYARIVQNISRSHKEVANGSIMPTLGITIVGNAVTFWGLAFAEDPVYVPLTPSLWCLPVESGGGDRYQLYTAFKAASVLLASIVAEAEWLTDGSPVHIEQPYLPQFKRLARYDDPPMPTPTSDSTHIDFRITGFVEEEDIKLNRHVYLASSSTGGGRLVIKLTRSYSPELHAFCARHGCAPKLYAYEKLAGGIIAVAMEYITGDRLHPASAHLQNKWTHDLKEIVKTMHNEGYVHGDLRPPNIFCVEDRMMVLNFDWGGKVGEARYPHTRLHPQLTAGRDMSCLKITKEDDDRVLKGTLDYIKGRPEVMEE